MRSLRHAFLPISLVISSVVNAASTYTLTVLPTTQPGYTTRPFGINNNGDIVGVLDANNGTVAHAFLYSQGRITDLGTFGGPRSLAYAINASGQITGFATTPDGSDHAFLYANGLMQDLGTLGGPESVGYAINNAGNVVGYSYPTDTAPAHPFLFSNGHMSDLGQLLNPITAAPGYATGINNLGQIVGNTPYGRPFLLSNGTVTYLPTLNNNPSDITLPSAINDLGQITGESFLTNSSHAFLSTSAAISDLGALPGGESHGLALNDLGDVVGVSSTNTLQHAFLYSHGLITDLNSLIDPTSGWTLMQATGINDAGQIIGWGEAPGHFIQGFLLTPTPEPASLCLLLSIIPLLATRRPQPPLPRRRDHVPSPRTSYEPRNAPCSQSRVLRHPHTSSSA